MSIAQEVGPTQPYDRRGVVAESGDFDREKRRIGVVELGRDVKRVDEWVQSGLDD
jgi:hypothetical protein